MPEEKQPKFKVGDKVIFPTYDIRNIGGKMNAIHNKCIVLESRKNVLGGYEYRIKGAVSSDLWIPECDLYDLKPEDNESPVEYLYNIGDHVYYHNKLAEVVDRNFMILNTVKRKYYTVRYIYLDSLPVYTTDYDVEYVPEAELSKVEVSKDEDTDTKLSSVDDDYEFENGDIVCYCGDKEISPKSKYYQIINSEKFNNQYYYRIKSYPLGGNAYTDQGNLFSKHCLTYVRDEVAAADKDKVEEEFKFDIGDKVSFRNEVYTVERKLHIGLNNYYKVKNVNTKSNHLATILESELTPYTEPETQKEATSPVDYKYEIGDTVKYHGKDYVVINRNCFSHSSGVRFYTLNLPCTSEREYVSEEVLLACNPEEDSEPKHEFHPTGDSSLADILMKGDFKEVYPAITEHFMKGGFKHPDYVHDKFIDNRDKTSIHPNLMRRTLMMPEFNIYDLGMGDVTPAFLNITTTVMVSQPLSNKSKDEILDNRYLALAKFINDVGDITCNIVVVDNLQFDRKPTAEEGELNHFDYLSTDIKLMKKIDYIIFAEGWQNSNGCNIEYQMAKTYGIPMYFA